MHRGWVLGVLCLSLLIVSLDNTVLNVALPVLVRDLSATDSQLQWIVATYSVVFAGLLLVAGSIGDRLGRKWVFLAGLLVFGMGSALSAFSGSPGRLIAARAVMGIGGAGIMPSTLSILSNVFTEADERARAIGIWSGTTGLGLAIGPVVGGWLLSRYWWGSIFLLNVPVVALALLGTALLVPDSRDLHSKRPDPGGAVLSTAGMGLLLWAIIEAPGRSWGSPAILGSLLGGTAVLGLFVAWERRSRHPMLELSLFRSRRFSVAMGALSLVLLGLMGGLFLLTQYLQFCLGFTPLQTGLRVAPVAAILLVSAPVSSLLARRIGTKPVVSVGLAVVGAGMLMLSRTTVAGTYSQALPAFCLLGLGAGLSFAPSTESVMGSLPLERTGIGSATNGAALQTGGALGVGVLGSLLSARYGGYLAAVLGRQKIPAKVRQVVQGSLGGALEVAQRVGGRVGQQLARLARLAFVSGLDRAMVAGAVLALTASVVVVVALPNRASRRLPAEAPGRAAGAGAGAG